MSTKLTTSVSLIITLPVHRHHRSLSTPEGRRRRIFRHGRARNSETERVAAIRRAFCRERTWPSYSGSMNVNSFPLTGCGRRTNLMPLISIKVMSVVESTGTVPLGKWPPKTAPLGSVIVQCR